MMATNRLSAALRQGGYVIVHRYTGTTRSDTPTALPNSIDDGQRLSAGGRGAAEQIGEVYRRLEIPVGQVVSSEYFFVYQTAEAAMARAGASVQLSCDPTGSP
jgi:broad specificity phosphatase PhoE